MALSGGTAKLTTTKLPLGYSTITSFYAGDSNYGFSTSAPVNQHVVQAITVTTLASSPNPSTYGEPVTFTAVVTSDLGAPPDGEPVSFMKSKTVLGMGTLSGGTATFATSSLPLHTNSISAVYGGDSTFGGSTSNVVKQVVNEGTHQGPFGVASPTAMNFGQVDLGQTSSAQEVSLENIGNSQLTISDISIAGDFAIATNHCEKGVKPGTHCNVYVTFTPQSLGADSGTLTFTDNASNSPQIVSLSGTGVN